jgi:hypothetical protein
MLQQQQDSDEEGYCDGGGELEQLAAERGRGEDRSCCLIRKWWRPLTEMAAPPEDPEQPAFSNNFSGEGQLLVPGSVSALSARAEVVVEEESTGSSGPTSPGELLAPTEDMQQLPVLDGPFGGPTSPGELLDTNPMLYFQKSSSPF